MGYNDTTYKKPNQQEETSAAARHWSAQTQKPNADSKTQHNSNSKDTHTKSARKETTNRIQHNPLGTKQTGQNTNRTVTTKNTTPTQRQDKTTKQRQQRRQRHKQVEIQEQRK